MSPNPDGLIKVPLGSEASFLSPLVIRKLPGIGKKTEQVLQGLGIKTIGQLANMPQSALKSRFGVFGEMLHRFANGIDDREVSAPGETRSISRETTFAEDMWNKSSISGILRYLTGKSWC